MSNGDHREQLARHDERIDQVIDQYDRILDMLEDHEDRLEKLERRQNKGKGRRKAKSRIIDILAGGLTGSVAAAIISHMVL